MKHEPRKFWSAETVLFLIYVKLFPYTTGNGESQTHAPSPIFFSGEGRGWLYTGYAAASKFKSDLLKTNEDIYSSAKSPNSMYVCVVGGKFLSTVQMCVLDYFAPSFCFFFLFILDLNLSPIFSLICRTRRPS